MYGRLYGPIGLTFRHLIDAMGQYRHPVGYSENYCNEDRVWRMEVNIKYDQQRIYTKIFESTDIDVLYNQVNSWLVEQIQFLQRW